MYNNLKVFNFQHITTSKLAKSLYHICAQAHALHFCLGFDLFRLLFGARYNKPAGFHFTLRDLPCFAPSAFTLTAPVFCLRHFMSSRARLIREMIKLADKRQHMITQNLFDIIQFLFYS